MLAIDKIQGNSGIGVPVFSTVAQRFNNDHAVFNSSKTKIIRTPQP
jgi:orotate phosphoribosyltransferase-like protein